MTTLVKVVWRFFGKSYVPAHRNHKGTLVKAHVRTYQRRSKSGLTVTVQEHDDKRRAAQLQFEPGRHRSKGERETPPPPPDRDDRAPTQKTPLPEVQKVEPPQPGELESWLLKIEQEPDIQQAMQEVSEGTATHLLYRQDDGSYSPERQRLHDEIVASMLNARSAAQEGQRPKVVILMGAPASGKTSALQPAAKELGVEFTVINADDVKEKLPEYTGRNAGLVHEESSDIAEGQLLPKAIQAQHHVLLDITGANGQKITQMVTKFHQLGYEITVLYAHLPIEQACARAVNRFRKRGRFVSPRYIASTVDGRPEQTYNDLKRDPRVTRWRRYSTDDIETNQKAALQEQSEGPGPALFGKAIYGSVRTHRSALRADGGAAERPDLDQSRSDPHSSPAVNRARIFCAQLHKSIADLSEDLSSLDLSPAERGVLLAARFTRRAQRDSLEALIEQATALNKSFPGHAGRPGQRGGSRPLHDNDVKDVMKQDTRSARRANPKLSEEEEEAHKKTHMARGICASILERARRARWTKERVIEAIQERLTEIEYPKEKIKQVVEQVRRLL